MDFVIGLVCAIAALALTFVIRIQRGRLWNNLWDAIVIGLCIAACYFLNAFGNLFFNLVLGFIIGGVCVLIRDFRLWWVRADDRSSRRRYQWYGRARDWWGSRRRRRY